MNKFLERYLPVFQLPEGGGGGTSAPTAAPSAPSAPSSAPSTPSSTPSATPSAPSSDAPSSTPAPADSGGSLDFAFLFGDGEETPEGASGLPPAVTPPPAPAAVPPKVEGAEPPKPVATPTPTPAAAPVAPAAPAPTAPTSAPVAQLDPYDLGALARALITHESAAIQSASETMFKLSPEEIEALETDTVGTVPKLLARTFIRAQTNILQHVARAVPMMIQRQTAMLQRHAENEDKFYSAWPDIKQAEHGDLVRQYAAVYRQMNPDATLEQMVQAVGPMVMMAGKITPSAPGVPAAAAARPASPMAPNGSRSPQPSPFIPAGPVSGGPTPSTVSELTPIEAMFADQPE